MNKLTRRLVPAAIAAASVFGPTNATAWDRYVVTPLVSDLPGKLTIKTRSCKILGELPFRLPGVRFGSPITPLVVRRFMTGPA
jgi:hypothetical protein